MNNNKKILYFVSEDWYFFSHRFDLAKDAMKLGHNVVLLTNANDKISEIKKEGIKVIPLRINRAGKNIFNEIRTFLTVILHIAKEKPDIIHNIFKNQLYKEHSRFFKIKNHNTFTWDNIKRRQ